MLSSAALLGVSVLILARIAQKRGWRQQIVPVSILLILPSVSLIDGIKDVFQQRLVAYFRDNDPQLLSEVLDEIPSDRSVAAPTYLLPYLSKRKELYTLEYLDMYPGDDPDYLVLDRNINRVWSNPQRAQEYAKALFSFSNGTDYEIVWQEEDYLLLEKT